ncbi:MAG: hypothetical protein ABJA50_13395, partial [Chloroflexota bacterium]
VLLLISALLVMVFARDSAGLTAPRLVVLVAAAVVTGVALFRPPVVRDLGRLRQAEHAIVALLVLTGLMSTGPVLARAVGDVTSPLRLVLLSAYVILGLVGAISWIQRLSHLKWAFWLFLAVHAALTVVSLRATPAAIDVQVFLHDGAVGLLHGHNPYSMTYPDIYSTRLTKLFYGPEVVSAGRITYGFPYLPAILFVAIPGQLLGDVRYSQLIAMLVTALVLRQLATDRVGRAAAILSVVAPMSILMLYGAWTEPALVALLACLVLALERRRHAFLAVLLGLFLVSKQYVVVVIPVLWLIRQWLTRRVILIGLGLATAVTVPFFLIDPPAFWGAIVEFQLVQPFRADSLSLLVSSVNRFGWPPPWTYAVLPLAGGGLTAIALAFRAPRTPAAFAAGVGLTLLVTILLSKQAFMNYYFLVSGALLISVVAWPTHQPDIPEES